MNPYFFTLAFLMMMSLLTSSEAIRFSQSAIEKTCYACSRDYAAAAEEICSYSQLEELKGEKSEKPEKRKPSDVLKKSQPYIKKVRALGVNAARPPDNSRLNFYSLLHKEPPKDLPKEFSLYEVIARLMRILYKDEAFFHSLPQAEYLILDKFIEKREETKNFTSPDQLCAVSLDNETLQNIFYQMVKGTKAAPSFLNFITFDQIKGTEQARKLNFLFAHPFVIKALFPEKDIAIKLLEQRERIWDEIVYQEENRSALEAGKGRRDFSEALKKAIDAVLSSGGIAPDGYRSQVFDCTLGKPGSIFFLEDPLTGQIMREKYKK